MSTLSIPIVANFGASHTGQLSNIGYTVYSPTGSVITARTTSGITELVDASNTANTGIYQAVASIDSSNSAIRIVWDISGTLYAEDALYLNYPSAPTPTSYTTAISANFGSSKTGNVGNIGYRVVDSTGTVRISRTTTGITERASSGVYEASITLNQSWGYVTVIWDITGLASAAAVDVLNTAAAQTAQLIDPASIQSAVEAALTTQGYTSSRATALDHLDANISTRAATGAQMTLDLTQAVPLTNGANTVGDALNAARADGFGAETVTGTTFTKFAPDGTTPVRVFTLDSATNPSSRT